MEFNVRTEPWIPVRTISGTNEIYGIEEVLCKAHELLEIKTGNPLIEYGILRFLMVLLMDIYQPEGMEALEDIRDEGQFDIEVIKNYWETCESEGVSFNLFDEKRPFMQSAFSSQKEKDKSTKPVSAMIIETPAGNAHTHFFHLQEIPQEISPAQAMQHLCAVNLFCPAGVQGYPSTPSGAPPVYSIVRGKNLFETLLYGLYHRSANKNFGHPVWRHNEEIVPKEERKGTSVLYGLSFPCRKICLIPQENGNISEIAYAQGLNYTGYDTWRDPYVTYYVAKDKLANLKASIDKEMWRNLAVLLDPVNGPEIINIARELNDDEAVQIITYGLVTNQASLLDIQRAEFTLPMAILKNEYKRMQVSPAIECVENQSQALGKAIKQLYMKLNDSQGSVVSQQQQSLRLFFAKCQQCFFDEFLPELDRSNLEQVMDLQEKWAKTVLKAGLEEYDHYAERLGMSAKVLVASEWARKFLYVKGGEKNEMDKKEKIQKYYEEIDALFAKKQYLLKRACGQMLEETDANAFTLFYTLKPYELPPVEENRWFFCGCLYCLWNAEERQEARDLPDIIAELYNNPETSDSFRRRMINMLDERWREDGFFAGKLLRLCKMLKSKGYVVDCKRLLEDLLCWNLSNRKVQKEWARKLARNEEEENVN